MDLPIPRRDGKKKPDAPGPDVADVASMRARIATLEAEVARASCQRADWSSMLAHEMRTPISVITGFARLLREELQAGEAHREESREERTTSYVNEIMRANSRLDRFVSDLLGACPSAESPFPVRLQADDLNEIVEATLEGLAPVLRGRRTQLDVKLCAELEPIMIDRDRIEQLVSNLVANAARHGQEGGRIVVSTALVQSEGAERVVRICVDDDGPGVALPDRQRIFEAYTQGDSESRREGLGIGLTLCERIVRSHSGLIRVDESELGGARFVVTLPCEMCPTEED